MKKFILTLIACTALAYATGDHCGTFQAIQNHKKQGRTFARTISHESCDASAYYDSIYTRNTDHFQIFYTLEGPHATTEAFVDSAAADLEKAWALHVVQTGMLPPKATDSTIQYRKPIQSGLYPVEIVELNMLRKTSVTNGYSSGCSTGCFGFTVPSNESDSQQSEILLDNDFYYIPSTNQTIDTILVDGTACTYPVATSPLVNQTDYSVDWGKGIRVTAFHEFYHALQLRYLNIFSYYTFWFEASAAGVEEIAAPDVNDYLAYLPNFFNAAGTPLDNLSEEYGAGTLYIYLYNHLGKTFDRSVWESFLKHPSQGFAEQLKAVAQAKNLAADSLFHDYATRLFFSGKRSSTVDSSFWICSDQPQWPTFRTKSEDDFTVPEPLAYNYYSMSSLDADKFTGKASAALYKGGHAELLPVVNTKSLDTIQVQSFAYDSLSWIVSRLDESEALPEEVTDSTLRAYPVPWREGSLCFTPLPANRDFIEIRNRRGDLVMRQKYSKTTLCIDESTVKQKMVPGVYRFRAGTKGKTRDFLIIY